MTHAPTYPLDDDDARRVVVVRAFDALPDDSPLWGAHDRDWASRLARQSCGASAPLPRFVAERARHAWQRLSARDPALARWTGRRVWQPAWLAAAAAGGLVLGLAADQLGSAQQINLLAVPVWVVVAWNLAIVALVLLQSLRHGQPRPGGLLRRWLTRQLSPARVGAAGKPATAGAPALSASARGAAAWAELALPRDAARAAGVLHVAAAALALGMVTGLYLRGLVLDYRVGWQSSFLDAGAVQRLLDVLLGPAAAISGVAVPAADGLRVVAGGTAVGPAAPWLHLYALTLLLFAVLPRVLLAVVALWQAGRWSADVTLPWDDAYFRHLALLQSGGVALVEVWPHGAAPPPAAMQALRSRLVATWGDALQIEVQAPARLGDEDRAERPTGLPAGPVQRVAWFDLTATPEPETQGRWVRTLQAATPAAPLLVVVDSAAFAARFGSFAGRIEQRREAWSAWAAALGVEAIFVAQTQEL